MIINSPTYDSNCLRIKDFPEGIIFKPPGSDSETKSILCTTPSNDDDVLVIGKYYHIQNILDLICIFFKDLSEEEIADILGSNKVEKKSPKQKRHRLIRKYLEITPSSGSDDKIGLVLNKQYDDFFNNLII